MNLFDGLFQRKSAFTKINTGKNTEHEIRLGRSLEQSNYIMSNSSPGSCDARGSFSYSSEPRSSSSDNEHSIERAHPGSLERPDTKNMSPLLSHHDNFMVKEGDKQAPTNQFGFLSG